MSIPDAAIIAYYSNTRLGEAEFVLTDGATSKSKVLDDFVSEYGDIASFAISLLADIYRSVIISPSFS
mgnify:CR=1 FL=1